MKIALLVLAACLAMAACAQDASRYGYFEKYGILDPGVSNRVANAMVRDGIRSEDPQIVESTIGALGRYMSILTPNIHFIFRSPYGAVPKRDFAEIPDLKQFLIGYWREQYRLNGAITQAEMIAAFDEMAADASLAEIGRAVVDRAIQASAPTLPDAWPPLDDEPSPIAGKIASLFSEWQAIPAILAGLYPGDADVLRFIWEMEEQGVGADAAAGLEASHRTLRLLNIGGFATPEANALRIGMLAAPLDDDARYMAAMEAARGLALSQPVEAIPALLSVEINQENLKHALKLANPGEVLVALAGYDDEVLVPYAADIARLLDRSEAVIAVATSLRLQGADRPRPNIVAIETPLDEIPLGAVPEAIERLRILVRRHSAAPADSPRAPDINVYRCFRDRGIFDPGVSSARANALVREGMNADDSRIVDATLRALGWFALHRQHRYLLPYGVMPDRNFAAVPGLKDSLLAQWRRHGEDHGRDSVGEFIQASGGELGTGNAKKATYEEMDQANIRVPAWRNIPHILCTLYPGDADVLRFVFDRHAGSTLPRHRLHTLLLLNAGRFATPEADALRLEILASKARGAAASYAARAAARGLALSRPAEAIPHLLSAGLRHDQGEGDVLATLAGYDAGSLLPHADELSQLLAKSSAPHPLGAVPEAIERLQAVVRLAAE